jgi:hypothetical protein
MSENQEKTDDLDIEIEIVDDTPEPDRNKPVAPSKTEDDDDIAVFDDEIGAYSKNVQKRIKDLTFKAHSERRAKESAAREMEEAVRVAQALFEENVRLKKISYSNEAALVNQAKVRAEVQIEGVKKAAKEAFEAGDTEQFMAEQERLQRLVNEHDRYSNYVPQQIPETQPPQFRQPEVKVDPKAQDWYKDNQWFDGSGETEQEMTAYAFGVSDMLIHKKKIDPSTSEYYDEISKAVTRRFPEYFAGSSPEAVSEPTPSRTKPSPAGTVVAPATRSVRTANKVVLTASQVRLARRFGLSPEQYAAQYVKDYGHG